MASPRQSVPRSSALVPGLLLMLYALAGVALLAVTNGVILAVLLGLFVDQDQVLAARIWIVPLAFLLALAEVGLYEWHRTRSVDLISSIRAAIQDVLVTVPAPPPAQHPAPPNLAVGPLEELQQVLASPPDGTMQQELTPRLKKVLEQFNQMPEPSSAVQRRRILRLKAMLEQLQRRQAAD